MSNVTALFARTLVLVFAVKAFGQIPQTATVDTAPAVVAQSGSIRSDLASRLDTLQRELDTARWQVRQQQAHIEQLETSLQMIIRMTANADASSDASTRQGATDRLVSPAALPVANPDTATAFGHPAPEHQHAASQYQQTSEPEGPTSIQYKGLSLTPGGFLEATFLVRTRNQNADIANNYSGIPLNGTTNSKLNEFRGSARDSRLSLLIEGNAGKTHLTGYFETDFLGAAPTANYVEANSFTPRVRQAWAQLKRSSGWTITGGQFWSLITTNRQGMEPRSEFIPSTADGSYVIGYNWTRGREFRVTKSFHDKFWIGLEVDQPENTYSAAFVPSNIMGLNTSQNTSSGVLLLPFTANYSTGISTTMAPDLLAKIALDPGWGHFEIKALGRFFRDRIASTATTVGFNNVSYGYGVGFGAILPMVRTKVDLVLEALAGQGIGRYSAAGLPDVTLDPVNGKMLPLRSVQFLGGVEVRPGAKVDLFGYVGNEYVGRYAAVTGTGGAAGYGSPLFSYLGCTNEVAMNTCSGANRNVQEATVGYWYHLFKGRFGSMQYGNQVVYMRRTLWRGIGAAPQGTDLVVYSTMRFYLP